MVISVFHWWWSDQGLDRAQVTIGVVGTILAAVALVYAWRVAQRQFTMMDEQGRVVERQSELLDVISKLGEVHIKTSIAHLNISFDGLLAEARMFVYFTAVPGDSFVIALENASDLSATVVECALELRYKRTTANTTACPFVVHGVHPVYVFEIAGHMKTRLSIYAQVGLEPRKKSNTRDLHIDRSLFDQEKTREVEVDWTVTVAYGQHLRLFSDSLTLTVLS